VLPVAILSTLCRTSETVCAWSQPLRYFSFWRIVDLMCVIGDWTSLDRLIVDLCFDFWAIEEFPATRCLEFWCWVLPCVFLEVGTTSLVTLCGPNFAHKLKCQFHGQFLHSNINMSSELIWNNIVYSLLFVSVERRECHASPNYSLMTKPSVQRVPSLIRGFHV
jgi:hypothetical protein